MRDEIFIFVKESQGESRKKARASIRQAIREGKPPSWDDRIRARGLVIRARDNSIFSDAWVPLAFLFILVGFAAGRHAPTLVLGITLLLMVGVSSWWKNRSLDGVAYERSFDRSHVFPGEPVQLTITVTNDKPLPLTWLQFKDELPTAPELSDSFARALVATTGRYILQSTFSLHGYERTRRHLTLQFPTRGYHRLGPVTYQSGDIFTLFTTEREQKYIDTLIVFPRIWPLQELGLPAKEPFGDMKVTRSLFTDPIKTQGIRDYQPQDRFRDVHWKATARRGSLQTKVYDPSTGMTLVAFLNVATFARHWMGFDPELLERAISVAGSIASYGAEQKWGIGLYANGSMPGSDQPLRVAPGRSPEQLNHILEALAAVTEFATGSIELLMQRESPRLPWAATLVLVTAIVTEEIAIGLMRLKEAGRRVVVISLADEPPPLMLHGIVSYHIPSSTPAFVKSGRQSRTSTEAALSAIPTPEPVELELDQVER